MQEQNPTDGGPIYAETNLEAFISEPWNAISSLAIVLPAIYWAFKLKWDIKNFGFMYFLIPLLFLGGMGSTLFHAFRASRLMLLMDVLPTAIVTLSVGIYFWNKILPKWWQVVMTIIPVTIFRFSLFSYFSGSLAVNLSYLITGILIFFPILFYLIKTNFQFLSSIVISVFCLSISLVFRRIDYSFAEVFPVGSHFLWHVFSGIGAYFLARYLYLIRLSDLKLSTNEN